MSYFDLTPPELIEVMIAYLNSEDVKSLINVYSYSNLLNWSTIFSYRVGYHINKIDKTLYLKYLSIQSLRTKIPRLSNMTVDEILNLTALNLSHNQLHELPPEIFELTNLVYLALSHNQLRKLPAGLSNLFNLQTLVLDNNQLQEIPTEILGVTNLQHLFLDNNQIRELPAEIGNLTNLQYLFLFGNQIQRVPAQLSNLKNLITPIDLRYNPIRIQYIPENLRRLVKL